jgi:hypothetical protein
MTTSDFDAILLDIWKQALLDDARSVQIADQSYPVRSTAKSRLKQVDFQFEGRDIRGREQNPNTKSRWAALARKGQKVMQFLEQGAYSAVVADGKLHSYRR